MSRSPPSAAADPGARSMPVKTPTSLWRKLMSGVVLLILVMVTPGTVLVLFFAMLPTGVAFVVDSSRGKYAASTVGGMNFAAMFPFLFDLWMHGNSVSAASAALTDAFAMTAIYVAAAFGWILHLGIPPIACAIHRVTSVGKISRLRMRQQRLIAAWGEEVAHPVSGASVSSPSVSSPSVSSP
jgi:hypothetical protein